MKKTIRIRMYRTEYGVGDNERLARFDGGQEYDMDSSLAEDFISVGAAYVVPLEGTVSKVPENKNMGQVRNTKEALKKEPKNGKSKARKPSGS